jgi:hypothetical protein
MMGHMGEISESWREKVTQNLLKLRQRWYRDAGERTTRQSAGAHGWMAPRLRPLIHGVMVMHTTRSSKASAKLFGSGVCSGDIQGRKSLQNQTKPNQTKPNQTRCDQQGATVQQLRHKLFVP